MKAIEYVKKVGFCEAKSVLLKSEYHSEVDVYLPDTKEFTYIAVSPTDTCPYVGLKDLREIVAAFDLVGNFGGLALSKYHLLKVKNSYSLECYYTDEHGNHFKTYEHVLEKAINLVEQCNAKS